MSDGSTRPALGFGLVTTAALALALGTGCMGGQTGTEQFDPPRSPPAPQPDPGSPTGGEHDSPCEDLEQPVDGDDDSLGFSANDMLALALGQRASELRWQPPPAQVSFGPESGVVAVELEVSLLGDVRKVHSVPKTSGAEGGGAIALQCPPDRLEADVALTITTAGGALDEQLTAVLSAGSGDFAELRGAISVGALNGSLEVAPGPGVKSDVIDIHAVFSEAGHAGVLSGNLDSEDPRGTASHSSFVYARWPADETCSALVPVVSVPLTHPSAEPLRSAVESLRGVEARPLEWRAAAPTTLTLELETAEVACLKPETPISAAGLELPVTVQARTGDGRIDSSLPGTLGTTGGSGVPQLLAVRTCEGATAALQAESCGISDFDFGDSSNLAVWLNATAAERASGALMIVGVRPTACEPTPDSSCPGNAGEPLETGEF